MVLIIAGGVISICRHQAGGLPGVLGSTSITVTVPYLGAAPEEVEEGVCVRIEEAIQGLDGIKRDHARPPPRASAR